MINGCRPVYSGAGPLVHSRGSALSVFTYELPPRFLQLRELGTGDLRVAQAKLADPSGEDRRDDGARHPLVVRGDDMPRGPLRAGFGEHLLVGALVGVPMLALREVGEGELPVFFRILQ